MTAFIPGADSIDLRVSAPFFLRWAKNAGMEAVDVLVCKVLKTMEHKLEPDSLETPEVIDSLLLDCASFGGRMVFEEEDDAILIVP